MSDDEFMTASGDPETVNKYVLSDWQGLVCMTFEKRCDRLTLTPREALIAGEAFSRQSYKSVHGDFPHGGTKQTIEQKRITCKNRVAQMLRTWPAPKSEAEFMAQAAAVVDQVMKLVT